MKYLVFATGALLVYFFVILGAGCSHPIGNNPVSAALGTPTPILAALGDTETETPTLTAPASTPTPTETITLTVTQSHTFTQTVTPTFTATKTPTITRTPDPAFSPTTTPHTTPTFQVPPTGIYIVAECIGLWDGSENATAFLEIAVNGAPWTSGGITLTTPLGDVPFEYDASSPNPYMYYPVTLFHFNPGEIYTITAITSIGTATASLAAPSSIVSLSADGMTASWAPAEGNEDYIEINNAGGYTFRSYLISTDLASPFSIPASAYPVAGNYTVNIIPQSTTYDFTGAEYPSRFTIKKYPHDTTFVKP